MSTVYTAFSHPAANFAIGRAAVQASRLLKHHGYAPALHAVGDAAYDTTIWIDELEDQGYLDDIEARIARQVTFVAMHRNGHWKPRCIRSDVASQAIWEAEIISATRRIRDLVRKQTSLFEEALPEETKRVPSKPTPNANCLFHAWLDEGLANGQALRKWSHLSRPVH